MTYTHGDREASAGLGLSGADDPADTFDVNRRFVPNRRADLEENRRPYPAIGDLPAWLRTARDRFGAISAA